MGEATKPDAENPVNVLTELGKQIIRARLVGENFNLINNMPGFHKWKEGTRDCIFRPTDNNIAYIIKHWPTAHWDEETKPFMWEYLRRKANAEAAASSKKTIIEDDGSYEYKTNPFDHQRQAFLLARGKAYFAYFMEQGTGKSKVTIDDFSWAYENDLIDCVIIVAPNGAHLNWILTEIPEHCPERIKHADWVYSAKKIKTKYGQDEYYNFKKKHDVLKIAAFNIEGFTSADARELFQEILLSNRCMVVVDEGHYIKNSTSARTKFMIKSCQDVPFKRILTGTPITKGIQDLYTQLTFLSTDILGYDSFYTFKNNFCIQGGFQMRQIVGYKNVDELVKLIDGHSYRKTKSECLDLPEKLYRRWKVELTPKQRELYQCLIKEYYADMEEHRVTAQLAIVRLLRLQQIICGWFPADNKELLRIPGDNPKLEAVLQHCESTDGKVIIWTQFDADIDLINDEMINKFGKGAVETYRGEVKVEDRMDIIKKFQDKSSDLRYIIAHPKAAGRSITLTACENPIYHSNSFDLELRLQSEDRCHRIGTTGNVTYTDVEAIKTIDRKVISALKKKKSIADLVNQDPVSFFMEDADVS